MLLCSWIPYNVPTYFQNLIKKRIERNDSCSKLSQPRMAQGFSGSWLVITGLRNSLFHSNKERRFPFFPLLPGQKSPPSSRIEECDAKTPRQHYESPVVTSFCSAYWLSASAAGLPTKRIENWQMITYWLWRVHGCNHAGVWRKGQVQLTVRFSGSDVPNTCRQLAQLRKIEVVRKTFELMPLDRCCITMPPGCILCVKSPTNSVLYLTDNAATVIVQTVPRKPYWVLLTKAYSSKQWSMIIFADPPGVEGIKTSMSTTSTSILVLNPFFLCMQYLLWHICTYDTPPPLFVSARSCRNGAWNPTSEVPAAAGDVNELNHVSETAMMSTSYSKAISLLLRLS